MANFKANPQRAVDALNVIREKSTENYQNHVPIATLENIQQIAEPIINYEPATNEFMRALINVIGLTVINNRIWENSLAILKKGTLGLGMDIQDIHTNPASSINYDMDSNELLGSFEKPDTKSVYYRLNRKDKFRVRLYDDELALAFRSYERVDELIASVINSLYNGDNIEEFKLMKKLFSECITNNRIVTELILPVTDETSAKSFVIKCRELAGLFKFPSSKYNKYSSLSGSYGNPVETFCPIEELCLIINSATLARCDVDVLALAFNMSKAEFLGRIIEVDDFGIATNCCAILMDRRFIQVWDNKRVMKSFYNGDRLEWRYFWHVWQTYSYSPFVNAVAFITSEITPLYIPVTQNKEEINAIDVRTNQKIDPNEDDEDDEN